MKKLILNLFILFLLIFSFPALAQDIDGLEITSANFYGGDFISIKNQNAKDSAMFFGQAKGEPAKENIKSLLLANKRMADKVAKAFWKYPGKAKEPLAAEKMLKIRKKRTALLTKLFNDYFVNREKIVEIIRENNRGKFDSTALSP